MLTRKRERFGDDVRLVGHWHVRRHRGQLDMQMETRVSPALQPRKKPVVISEFDAWVGTPFKLTDGTAATEMQA